MDRDDGRLAATSKTSNYIYITLNFLTFQHAREKRVKQRTHMKYENGGIAYDFHYYYYY